jgi:hypothetical protein
MTIADLYHLPALNKIAFLAEAVKVKLRGRAALSPASLQLAGVLPLKPRDGREPLAWNYRVLLNPPADDARTLVCIVHDGTGESLGAANAINLDDERDEAFGEIVRRHVRGTLTQPVRLFVNYRRARENVLLEFCPSIKTGHRHWIETSFERCTVVPNERGRQLRILLGLDTDYD